MLKKGAVLALTLILGMLLGCEEPLEPAPEDLRGLAYWLWLNYDVADDVAMGDAMTKAHRVLGFGEFTESDRGLLDDLGSEDLAHIGLDHRDPEPAQGMYLTNMFDCDIPTLEGILYDLDQGNMYPEVYDTYERVYTADLDAYQSRESMLMSWDVHYEATPMPAAKYRAMSKGGLRYVGSEAGVELPFGPAVLQRIYMPEPVEYLETDANEFLFDFQMELYYQAEPGRIAHFYPVWRHMAFNGVGASTADNWIIDTILDGLLDWDVRTEELCAERSGG